MGSAGDPVKCGNTGCSGAVDEREPQHVETELEVGAGVIHVDRGRGLEPMGRVEGGAMRLRVYLCPTCHAAMSAGRPLRAISMATTLRKG